ncbi:uncharacterized protein PAC_17576 [Phialocephala subalpina]|uniref:Uncharacterized protein n=1 Tax=Phialocephala subalpina TaxID=576137 RepID=A0A1L7XRW9_9HELO|nr:uncharacterized protein PAC_17576 [Phialocephala subalpina]
MAGKAKRKALAIARSQAKSARVEKPRQKARPVPAWFKALDPVYSYSGSFHSHDDYDQDPKEKLKERKKQEKLERKLMEKEKREEMAIDISKEKEVNAAWEAFEKDKEKGITLPLESLVDKRFTIYCKDFVELCTYCTRARKRLDFEIIDPDTCRPIHPPTPPTPGEATCQAPDFTIGKPIDAQIYLDSAVGCQFQLPPDALPTHASSEPMSVTGYESLKIIFFSNQYLKVFIPRSLMESCGGSQYMNYSRAPEVFAFVGILRDEEEKKERERMLNSSIYRSSSDDDFY